MRFSSVAVHALALLAASSSFSQFGVGPALVCAQEEVPPQETVPVVEDTVPVAEETAPVAEKEEKAADYVPPSNAEKYGFQAEVHRMLDIVVNSLYQHKDVFLRELISNASDALDKMRYLSLTDPERYNSEDIPLEVQIEYDEEAKTVTIRDTGVGMTHDEMVENLGTVARSGTTKFIQALKESGNDDQTMSQIGQFGVGFYSSFLVADRVTVASKSPLDPVQHIWESSNGSGDFFIYDDPRGNSLKRGTEITLYLKEDESHYADSAHLKSLAQHFSEFVIHPISVRITETMEVEVDDEEESDAEKKTEDDDFEVTDDDDDEDKPKKTKQVTTHSWEVVNGEQAIWTRDKDEITDEEYQNFYKLLAGDENSEAATWSHFNAEGNINFKSILYLPEEVPTNYKYGNMDSVPGAVKLYVRKVLIGEDFEFLPKYLGFIRGVVDSDDLTLNVNRETLQEEKTIKVIRKKVVKKAIDLIRQLAKDSETKKDDDDESDENEDNEKEEGDSKYIQWYKKFSPNIKIGILEDHSNRSRLMKLLRFETSKSNGKYISLEEYGNNMKDWQKDIYVLGCATASECASSPFLEPFREKDVEVIYMTDAVDEYLVKQVRDFEKKKLVQISNENVKFQDEDEDLIKRREKVYKEKFQPLTKWLRKLYHGSVLRVQVAKRNLGSVPAIVTSSEYGNSANMERILKAQAYQYGQDPQAMMSMKVFELNPRHPLILKLLEAAPEDADDDKNEVPAEMIDAAWHLHDMAMLNGGFQVHDPEAHNRRLAKVLQTQFGLDSLALEPEINPPVEEDEPPEMDMGAGGMNMDDLNLDDDPLAGMDPNNIDIEKLKEQFPDAGWPDMPKKEDNLRDKLKERFPDATFPDETNAEAKPGNDEL